MLPIDGTSVSLEYLRDENVFAAGQLPGNHSLYPHGVLLYLYPHELTRVRGLGLDPVEVGALPGGIVPTGGHLHECNVPTPPDRYCEYDDPTIHARCTNETIVSRLRGYAGRPYVDLVELSPRRTPELNLPIYGLRIGARATEGGVPQVLVVATQHAREWVTTEAAMSLIDHYVEQYAVVGSPEHMALQDIVLLVVPVSNPDGYEYTQTAHREPQPSDWSIRRDWRPTRDACSVDMNRNFPFSRKQPGAGSSCVALSSGANSTYHGGDTTRLEAQASMDAQRDPDFPTVLALNVHSYGQLVLYSDGVSAGFAPCTTNSNCSHPDVPVQMLLGGDHREAKFRDLVTGAPYRPGQTYRTLYDVSGDFGSQSNMAENVMPLSLEIGRGTCRFRAETRHDELNEEPAKQLREMIETWLALAPDFADGSVYDTDPELGAYVLPHLHRRAAHSGGVGEHPTLRVSGRRHISTITVLPNNGAASAFTDFNDDVLPGIGYKSFRWRPAGDPFTFPTLLRLCAAETNCEEIRMVGDGSEVDICAAAGWSTDGWSHEGRASMVGTVQDQCYWYLTGMGSGVIGGESDVWTMGREYDLSEIIKTHLTFSFDRLGRSGIDLRIKASRSGSFDPCDASTECRTVYASRLPHGVNRSGAGMRTEIVDISDFDGGFVSLRWELRDATPTDQELKIYDPVLVGFRR